MPASFAVWSAIVGGVGIKVESVKQPQRGVLGASRVIAECLEQAFNTAYTYFVPPTPRIVIHSLVLLHTPYGMSTIQNMPSRKEYLNWLDDELYCKVSSILNVTFTSRQTSSG